MGQWLVLFVSLASALPLRNSEVAELCPAASEFSALIEDMREREGLKLPSSEMIRLALEATKGCTGAARRFAKIVDLLTKAKLPVGEAVPLAANLSAKGDAHVEVFVAVFQQAFLRESLDLDLRTSLSLAKSISTDLKGDPKKAWDDFSKILNFCLYEPSFGLSKFKCAQLASEVSRKGSRWDSTVANAFIKLYQYIKSEAQVNFTASRSRQIALEVIEDGSAAVDNFIAGFEYARSDSGLNLGTEESLAVAKKISALSIKYAF